MTTTAYRTFQKSSPIIIRPASGWNILKVKELWFYRELFFILALRNIQVRYKQTILGVGWALLQPLGTMLVFSIFFGRLANMPSDGIPYPIFALSGLIPWIFFSNAVTSSAGSIIADANLIKKVYFPRIIIPFSSVCSGLLDFSLSFALILIIMPFYEIYPNVNILLLPLLTLFLFMAAIGVGLWLATMNALFRDIHHIIPFGMQIWLFMTPIVYPSSLLSPTWKLVLSFNPIMGIVETFRWMMLGTTLSLSTVIISATVILVLFFTGIIFFKKMEPYFADIV